MIFAIVLGWLHSIPVAHEERLVTNEHVCGSSIKEALMDKVNEAVRSTIGYLKKWSFTIVVILSIFHLGLTYIHARESGGATPHLVVAA
jgi:hypothetical protein